MSMSKVVHDMKFAVEAAKMQQAATATEPAQKHKALVIDEGAELIAAGFEIEAGNVRQIGGYMSRDLTIKSR